MKFEKDPKIDELLNGFLDGELSPEEDAYVHRLVSEDEGVAGRLREIDRCRLLVSSLPPAEPPAEVVSGIKMAIRNRLDGSLGKSAYAEQVRGERHLFVRHVLAASIIVGLVGILGAVVYKIVGPESNAPKIVAVRPAPAIKPAALPVETKKAVTVADDTSSVGQYSLRLTTTDFVAVDAFINKLLNESPWLKYDVTKQSPKRSVYSVLCSKGGLEALANDLSAVWPKFDSATLAVQADSIGQSVTVQNIRPEQITDIVNQDTTDARVRLAKDFATLNAARQTTPQEKMLAFSDRSYPELTTIPKPALTSGQKTPLDVPEGANDKVRVDLTIVVSGHK
jgi:hypothetical protein